MHRFALLLPFALAACAPEPAERSPAPNAPTPAATPPAAPAERSDPRVLTLAGVGDLVIGKPPPPGVAETGAQISEDCRILLGDAYPGVYAISDGKVVQRITLMRDSPVKTQSGLGVGASEAEVRKAFPRLAQTLHDYVAPPGKNLTYQPVAGGAGLRFEIDGEGRATLIHAGLPPWLELSEGCA